jgi:hypothetical protein
MTQQRRLPVDSMASFTMGSHCRSRRPMPTVLAGLVLGKVTSSSNKNKNIIGNLHLIKFM